MMWHAGLEEEGRCGGVRCIMQVAGCWLLSVLNAGSGMQDADLLVCEMWEYMFMGYENEGLWDYANLGLRVAGNFMMTSLPTSTLLKC